MEIDQQQIDQVSSWLGNGSINFFGYPYAGKDSQGNRFVDILGGTLIGGGNVLRNSVVPTEAQEIMDNGGLVPTEDFIQIVLPYLGENAVDNQPLMLSALGRWSGEEKGVMEVLNQIGHPLKSVVYLQLSEEEVWRRWAIHEAAKKAALEATAGTIIIEDDRGDRNDYHEEKLRKRLTEFNEKTIPVLEFYRNLGLLIEIDGNAPKDDVTKQILGTLALTAV